MKSPFGPIGRAKGWCGADGMSAPDPRRALAGRRGSLRRRGRAGASRGASAGSVRLDARRSVTLSGIGFARTTPSLDARRGITAGIYPAYAAVSVLGIIVLVVALVVPLMILA